MKSLMDKRDFIGLDNCTWFYSGAETPTHRAVLEAVTDYMTARSLGPVGRERNAETEQSCKRNLARLLGSQPEQIALMSSASEAISMIAQSILWEPGDNVVLHMLEFPSGVLPWLMLKSSGVEVRVVPHRDWQIDEADILHFIDSRTKLVVTSHVSFLTGLRIDYRALYERVARTNALLLLDATQSLGVIPVDASLADIVVSSSYKWLLSVHGGGLLAVNPQRAAHLMPKYVGWRSVAANAPGEDRFSSFTFHPDARRFELGYPAYPTVYALERSSRLLLELGVDNIERHITALGEEIISLLASLGLKVTTPSDAARRAGNICFLHNRAEEIAGRLMQKGIYVMGGEGRVRFSVHAFNDSADVDLLRTHLPDCLKEEESRR